MLELTIGLVVAVSDGNTFVVDMENDEQFEMASSDDADIFLQLDIGPKDEDWKETFSVRVVTPNNMPPRTNDMKNMRVHSYSFQTLKNHLVTAVKVCQRETWDECLEALRSKFHWECDTPNRKRKK